MRGKQDAFVRAYCDQAAPSFGNATLSAKMAGYSPKNAATRGCQLLKLAHICKYIQNIKAEQYSASHKTREDKAAIAWTNYQCAKTDADKRFWWEEHGKLLSQYVQRQEITSDSKVTVQAEAEQINDAVRRARQTLAQPVDN